METSRSVERISVKQISVNLAVQKLWQVAQALPWTDRQAKGALMDSILDLEMNLAKVDTLRREFGTPRFLNQAGDGK